MRERINRPAAELLARNRRMVYVAYGSNLCMDQMKLRCPNAKPLSRGVLEGYRLTFHGRNRIYGVADVVPDPGRSVPVGLWTITRRDLESLDRYEGWPRLYLRDWVPVRLEDGSTVHGLIYVMTGEHRVPAIPHPEYLGTIVDGYRDFGLDLRELYRALDEAVGRFYPE